MRLRLRRESERPPRRAGRRKPRRAFGPGEWLLHVSAPDPEVERRGRVLASMLLGLGAYLVALSIYNLAQGDYQYNLTNLSYLAAGAALFALNRAGFVLAASVLVVAASILAPVLIVEVSMLGAYLAMALPILMAGSLIVPWSSILVAAVMVGFALRIGIGELGLILLLLLFTFFSYLLASSIDRAYRQSRHQALHDYLTDLPNRVFFENRVEQALGRSGRDGRLCAVLFVDIDDFKVVNDSLGHEVGDELLKIVGRRLNEHTRSADMVARLGGDEFALLLDGVQNVSEAVRVAERIIASFEEPVVLARQQFKAGASIGISFSADAREGALGLVRDADLAMYEAKKAGKGRAMLFDAEMYVRSLQRLELQTELRSAIESGDQMRVYYQPQVSLESGRIVSFEALVRWDHPARGMVAPDEFIPLAEETGLIIPLGRQVLRTACEQRRAWHDDARLSYDGTISVNLSAMQFREAGGPERLRQLLRQTHLAPELLHLELTESTITEDEAGSLRTLRAIKSLGVKLALDDFGTGYSSLAAIRQYPFDVLKIDRRFVVQMGREASGSDERDAAIIRLVCDLAHVCGMSAVAEGVETADQEAALKTMGCDTGQGYYYSKPLSAEQATALLMTGG